MSEIIIFSFFYRLYKEKPQTFLSFLILQGLVLGVSFHCDQKSDYYVTQDSPQKQSI